MRILLRTVLVFLFWEFTDWERSVKLVFVEGGAEVEVSWNQGCWIGFRCPDCTLDPVSWTQECCFHLRQAYTVSLPDGEECLCVPSYWKELILQRLPFICINNGLYITWFPYRVPYNGLKEYSWLANAFNAAEKPKRLAGKSERASTSK